MIKLKKKFSINVPILATVWYVGTNMLGKAFTFFSTPFFTRLLSPSQYGTYSLYVSWMSVFTVISTLEISGNISIRGFSGFKNEKSEFSSSALGVQVTLTAFFLLIYMLFSGRINAITGLSTKLTVILLIQVFLNSVIAIYFAEKRYSYKYKTVSYLNVLMGTLIPVCAIFIITLTRYKGYARIISSLFISGAVCIPIIILTLRRCIKIYSRKMWKYIFGYAIPLLPHYLSLSIVAQGDKILLSRIAGSYELGKYTVAHSVGFTLSLVTGGLLSAATPWIHRKLESHENEKITDAINICAKLLLLMVLIFLTVLPEIFRFIGGNQYYSAIDAVYPIAISTVLIFLANVYTSIILHNGSPLSIAKNSITSAIIAVVGGYIIIQRFGYLGAAYSSFIAYFALFILNLVSANKISSIKPLNFKSISCGLVFAFTLQGILIFVRDILLSRILVGLSLILMLIPMLPRCLDLLKNNKNATRGSSHI